ncbi:MAG: DUF3800 domain-containing protein [Anaerolinea sp.]|nr:DUF3800 domain-containing protein [Anaerolinea sp.]
MKVVYIDESGSPAPGSSEKYFVVAALTTDSPRIIQSQLKRMRRSLGVKLRDKEIKAAQSQPVVIKRFLRWLGQQELEIYVVIVDQQNIPKDSGEILYQTAVARVISHCLVRYPRLHVYLDRRYTNRHQAVQLERTIRQEVKHIPEQILIIEQVDSAAHFGLQAVDFVAWALRKKYELGESWAAELIERIIVAEELIENKKSGSAW